MTSKFREFRYRPVATCLVLNENILSFILWYIRPVLYFITMNMIKHDVLYLLQRNLKYIQTNKCLCLFLYSIIYQQYFLSHIYMPQWYVEYWSCQYKITIVNWISKINHFSIGCLFLYLWNIRSFKSVTTFGKNVKYLLWLWLEV